MRRLIRHLIYGIVLLIPLNGFAQCDKLLSSGKTLMKSKKWEQAITKLQAAKECNSSYTEECNKLIKTCRYNLSASAKPATSTMETVSLTVDRDNLLYGSDTTSGKQVKVASKPELTSAESNVSWCRVIKRENDVVVICDPNPETKERECVVTLSNGKMTKLVTVKQDAKLVEERFAVVGEAKLAIKKSGEIKDVTLDANVAWDVLVIPDWCKVVSKEPTKLYIQADKTKSGREGAIILRSERGTDLTIIVSQKKNNAIF